MIMSEQGLYDVTLSQNIGTEDQIKLVNAIAEESVSYYLLYHTLKNLTNLDTIEDPSVKIHDTITQIHTN
jgi:hypothetical protein